MASTPRSSHLEQFSPISSPATDLDDSRSADAFHRAPVFTFVYCMVPSLQVGMPQGGDHPGLHKIGQAWLPGGGVILVIPVSASECRPLVVSSLVPGVLPVCMLLVKMIFNLLGDVIWRC